MFFGTSADPGDDDDNDLDDDADLAEELMLGMENGVSWLEADRDELGDESCNMSQCLEKVKSRMLKITTSWEKTTPLNPNKANTALRVMRLATVANNKLKKQGSLACMFQVTHKYSIVLFPCAEKVVS